MLTFSEAMATIEDGEKASILLGNGFSRAWRNDIFNYASLFYAANFGEREEEIKSLFEISGTHDFEAVMRSLVSAKNVLSAYGADNGLILKIENDQELLKQSLIAAISTTHPDRPSAVTLQQYTKARAFISQFNHIFTVNYDLLLYWARNMQEIPPENYSTDDGFRAGCQWRGYDTDQEVHFLHGGLHIYDDGYAIKKLAFSETGAGIVDLVRWNLNKGKFPLFVSEPSSEKKKEKIDHNPYLNYCSRMLRKAAGTFFIHGHSVDENDKHIFDELKQSNVNTFYISIYGDQNSAENTRVKANARAFLETPLKQIFFYQAETAAIWA